MYEHLEEFDEEPLPSGESLPEDEETLQRTIDLTKEAFSSPRAIKPDHIYYAIEGWENLQANLSDAHAADLAGEVVELLQDVFRRRHLTFEEAQRGKRMVRTLAQFFGISARRDSQPWE